MKLYQRDFCTLTPAEQEKWESIKKKEVVRKSVRFEVRKSSFRDYPKAIRHYLSLFPNNYLDILELQETERLTSLVEDFVRFVDLRETKERDIIDFVKKNQAFFIIGSLLKYRYFEFGHHDAFLFPEFQLGNSYQVDYLIVGRGSGGYQMVLVELQSPYGSITISKGNLGSVFRKGLEQIDEWDKWIESYYPSLKETFDKYKKPCAILPDEFYTLDKSRIHYLVIAGRRSDFTDRTYRNRRLKKDVLILHYDNLIDLARYIINKNTY